MIFFVDCLVVGFWKMDNHKLHSQSLGGRVWDVKFPLATQACSSFRARSRSRLVVLFLVLQYWCPKVSTCGPLKAAQSIIQSCHRLVQLRVAESPPRRPSQLFLLLCNQLLQPLAKSLNLCPFDSCFLLPPSATILGGCLQLAGKGHFPSRNRYLFTTSFLQKAHHVYGEERPAFASVPPPTAIGGDQSPGDPRVQTTPEADPRDPGSGSDACS